MKDTIKALEIYKLELEKLKEKYNKKFQMEFDKYNKKIEKFKEEYPDLYSIDESYACGIISLKKRDELYSIYDNLKDLEKYESTNGLIVKMLEEDIKNLQYNLLLENKKI